MSFSSSSTQTEHQLRMNDWLSLCPSFSSLDSLLLQRLYIPTEPSSLLLQENDVFSNSVSSLVTKSQGQLHSVIWATCRLLCKSSLFTALYFYFKKFSGKTFTYKRCDHILQMTPFYRLNLPALNVPLDILTWKCYICVNSSGIII